MKCPKCGTGTIVGKMTITIEVPLLRGGGVNLSGVRITKEKLRAEAERLVEAKEHWVSCTYCNRQFAYTRGEGLLLDGTHIPVPKNSATSSGPKKPVSFVIEKKEHGE